MGTTFTLKASGKRVLGYFSPGKGDELTCPKYTVLSIYTKIVTSIFNEVD